MAVFNSFQLHEVNNFLGDVLSRLNQNRAFENHYAEMYSIIDKVVAHTKSFERLLISVSYENWTEFRFYLQLHSSF